MATIKAEMDIESTKTFLNQYFDNTVSNLTVVDQGEVSKVYFFQHQGKDYVVRFKDSMEGYQREKLLYSKLINQGIPMAKILDINTVGELYFSISERIPGKSIISYQEKDIFPFVPKIVELFARINQLDLRDTHGYGLINESGNGENNSWSEFLEDYFDEKKPGFWHGWYQLFDESFIERNVYNLLFSKMMELSQYSSNGRYLVHGDFHIGNMIGDEKNVTGIIDWEMAMYGDFVFDLATIHLWTPQFEIPRFFLEYCQANGIKVPHYQERFTSALLCKGLDALRFFAKTNHEGAYTEIRDQLLSYLKKDETNL